MLRSRKTARGLIRYVLKVQIGRKVTLIREKISKTSDSDKMLWTLRNDIILRNKLPGRSSVKML